MTTGGANGNVIRINNILVGCKFDWSLMAPKLLLVLFFSPPLPPAGPSHQDKTSATTWPHCNYQDANPLLCTAFIFNGMFLWRRLIGIGWCCVAPAPSRASVAIKRSWLSAECIGLGGKLHRASSVPPLNCLHKCTSLRLLTTGWLFTPHRLPVSNSYSFFIVIPKLHLAAI